MDDCNMDSLQTTTTGRSQLPNNNHRTKPAALASSNDEAKSKISLTQHEVVYTVARKKVTAVACAQFDAGGGWEFR